MKARSVPSKLLFHFNTWSAREGILALETVEDLLALLDLRVWGLEHGYYVAGETRRCPGCGSSNLREYWPGDDYDPGLAHDYDGQCNWCGREYLDSEVWVESPPAENGGT